MKELFVQQLVSGRADSSLVTDVRIGRAITRNRATIETFESLSGRAPASPQTRAAAPVRQPRPEPGLLSLLNPDFLRRA